MRRTSIWLQWLPATVALSSMFQGAMACDGLGANGVSPLTTRKPVLGENVRLTSGYGLRIHPLLMVKRLHTGVDWAAPVGALVITAGAGRVLSAADDGPYGNKLVIDHGGGVRTIYAQLSRFNVREGDCVEAGQVVAAVGNTGLSSGPHLHYETHVEGKVVDPMTVQLGNSVNR